VHATRTAAQEDSVTDLGNGLERRGRKRENPGEELIERGRT
jgi:hypothetical protein